MCQRQKRVTVMPAASSAGGTGVLWKGGVGRMFELKRYDFKALVIEHCAVADKLHLRNTRYSLEVWMQNGLVGLFVFPCPYDSDRVKCLWMIGVRACLCIK
jgi:hypothetical protein